MKKGDILELEIVDLAFGGRGLATVGTLQDNFSKKGYIIFIDGALPGQTVKVQIKAKKKRYADAKILEILKPSPDEIPVPYQVVPGAPWALLPVEKQLIYKKQQVFELFKKFAEVDLTSYFDEVISSPETWNYRNKMEFSFGFSEEDYEMVEDKKVWHHFGFALGSKKRGQYWLVENLERPSGLFDEEFESLIPEIRKFCEETGLPIFNQKTGQGFFRHMVVRKSFFEDKFLVNLVTTSLSSFLKGGSEQEGCSFTQKEETELNMNYTMRRILSINGAFQEFLRSKLGARLKGLFWSQNDNTGDSAQNFENRTLLHGEEILIEQINDLDFEISLDSFFQTNPVSAEKLYQKVIEYAHLDDGDKALDLYCGTGTIGQILAKFNPGSSISGVEIVESAIKDARKNSRRNGLKNIEFYCDDVRKFLKENSALLENLKLVVLDPPRAGLSPKALNRTLDLKAKNLIYVSCNPATMSRDTVMILEAGYCLEQFSIIDQFPHTSHVECVGKFVKE